ncbi:hypothetical protein [Haloarcula sebkhae]|uniref:Uncharacterized protein n=2 Tax=Haloarcula sebkhae TaxID=932660 RepID=A0ACC6VMA9_9EURY|nr:hypothetical protein [Haloarcula sebkhae]GGK83935.1 hypothetical protein GCM10009067_40130 [Haloarcula sebkhae]
MADDIDNSVDDLIEIGDHAEELDGENEVPLSELSNPSFTEGYTNFDQYKSFLGKVHGLWSRRSLMRFQTLHLMSTSQNTRCSLIKTR